MDPVTLVTLTAILVHLWHAGAEWVEGIEVRAAAIRVREALVQIESRHAVPDEDVREILRGVREISQTRRRAVEHGNVPTTAGPDDEHSIGEPGRGAGFPDSKPL